MSKIMICSIDDAVGGAEQVLKMIASYFIQCGCTVDVYFLTKPKADYWKDLKDKINLMYTNTSSKIFGFIELFFIMKKTKCEYTYGFTSHVYCNSFIGLLKQLKIINIKYFIGRDSEMYFDEPNIIKRFFYCNLLLNIGYSAIDLLIHQTNEMNKNFLFHKKELFQKILIKVIPNPVDLKYIQASEKSLFQYNGIANNYIVAAGRLLWLKGFHILIRAFKELNLEDCSLLILGDGEYKKELNKLIEKLNLYKKVHLLGYVDNVYPYFRNAKLCVVPSIIDNSPNVLFQMISQNTKIVATRFIKESEYIKGLYICNPDDVHDLAKKIMECLNTDTQSNRELFDRELEKRSINHFIEAIEKAVQ
ncbi:putative lipopolysaccharide biosynthesis [Treponema primitia ZAS-2]|uniref:Putative lipopolysaccharide biosynthesis n=1 Tax=Treponema primitia (strain ATCC BAA-887 / DSM 12427 / ZAS-2) TaxID=545694 RepID=F5YN37_TREPZ|nr:glycosyltransferase [Treponema primitia]AEF86750.1 putative lipopolysaccharide biosynthesis [Treponema primitia ZAS-2]